MNNKFFGLSIEKQRRIVNAAYKAFSENSYKKAPMSEIADEGGVSEIPTHICVLIKSIL